MNEEDINNLEKILINPNTEEDTKGAVRQMLRATMERQLSLAAKIEEILNN